MPLKCHSAAGLQMIPTPIQVPKMGIIGWVMRMMTQRIWWLTNVSNTVLYTDQIKAGMYELWVLNFEPDASRSKFGGWSILESWKLMSRQHLSRCQPHLSRCQPHLSCCQPHLSRCQPHLSRCQPHLSRCQPHLSCCQPHLSRCQPHLSRCQPHLSRTSAAVSRTSLDLSDKVRIIKTDKDYILVELENSDEELVADGRRVWVKRDTFFRVECDSNWTICGYIGTKFLNHTYLILSHFVG